MIEISTEDRKIVDEFIAKLNGAPFDEKIKALQELGTDEEIQTGFVDNLIKIAKAELGITE